MAVCGRIALMFTILALLASCSGAATLATTPTSTTPVIEQPTVAAPTPVPVSTASPGMAGLRGDIVIDGSSTVFPITERVQQAFGDLAPGVTVRLGVSGTSAGFEKFCTGQTVISDASRPIKAQEDELCGQNGIAYIELPVAFDGITLVVNPSNTWAQCLTTAELKRLWEPAAENVITRWSQIRDGWPDRTITLLGAGVDSGTFDYFTSAIVGAEGQIRRDYIGSEDDYVLTEGVVTNPDAMAYVGYAYFNEYRSRLNAVAIDAGNGCVLPSTETIDTGSYQPLSRPLFIYVSAAALDRPEVAAFVDFYLQVAPQEVANVGYAPLPARAYELAARRVRERTTGSVFSGGVQIGVSIEQLLELESK